MHHYVKIIANLVIAGIDNHNSGDSANGKRITRHSGTTY